MNPHTARHWMAPTLVAGALLMASVSAQSAPEIYLATYFAVRAREAPRATALADNYVRATRAEPGNLQVDAFQEVGRPDRFLVIETWADADALAGHDVTPHAGAFRQGLEGIHRAPYDRRLHTGFLIDPATAVAPAGAVYVATHVDVPGPSREAAEALLTQLIGPSRRDAGHLRYDVYQQYAPRTNHFTVFAAWQDMQALDAYGATEHWQAFRGELGPMLGALYDERFYRRLGV